MPLHAIYCFAIFFQTSRFVQVIGAVSQCSLGGRIQSAPNKNDFYFQGSTLVLFSLEKRQ